MWVMGVAVGVAMLGRVSVWLVVMSSGAGLGRGRRFGDRRLFSCVCVCVCNRERERGREREMNLLSITFTENFVRGSSQNLRYPHFRFLLD